MFHILSTLAAVFTVEGLVFLSAQGCVFFNFYFFIIDLFYFHLFLLVGG